MIKASMKKFTASLLDTIFAFTLAACSSIFAKEAGERLDEIAYDAENEIEGCW
jgi:starvation-inducible outer membrane lipoprotein